MRSRASLRGHPIHPALIPFPFAFLYGAFFFDLAGRLANRPSWWTTGGHLGLLGIAAALVAAIPGFIDYVRTVPPNSSGKRRATKHMLVNLGAVILFALAWVFRGDAGALPGLAVLALEAVGLGLLTAGGWMGGVLVNRNQIGVDHRYARAGKWKEETVQARSDGASVVVARTDELQPDQMKLLHVVHPQGGLSRRGSHGGRCGAVSLARIAVRLPQWGGQGSSRRATDPDVPSDGSER
jgi:uncharacterized membrane protein